MTRQVPLVHESLVDAFNDAIKRILADVTAGHAAAPNQLRGLFNAASVYRVRRLVEQAQNAGAKVILGEDVKPESEPEVTNVMQPAVLDHVAPDMGMHLCDVLLSASTHFDYRYLPHRNLRTCAWDHSIQDNRGSHYHC